MSLAISGEELLRWNDFSAQKWRAFANTHPELLGLSCDIRESGTAAHLLQHIVAVELRYAQRLASQPETEYTHVPCSTADEIFRTHDRAITLIRSIP